VVRSRGAVFYVRDQLFVDPDDESLSVIAVRVRGEKQATS